jgi:hypothetical protein
MTATAAPLLDCGHPSTADAGIGTGDSADAAGFLRCYACSDAAESAAFLAADRYTAYETEWPSTFGYRLTTWLGHELARVTSRTIGRGGFGSRVVYLRAVAPDGSRWYGRHSADWSECVTLHRCKGGAS